MKKTEMIDDITSMLGEMAHFMEVIIKQPDVDIHYDEVRKGHKWIKEIYENFYKPIIRIYRVHTPEQWDRFIAWGEEVGYEELDKLNHAKKEMNKALRRKRPAYFKTTEWKKVEVKS